MNMTITPNDQENTDKVNNLKTLEKSVFVQDLKVKDDVKGLFYVKYISVMEARDGKEYINIILSDATGEIEGRIWKNAQKIIEDIQKGQFVEILGKVNNYQGRRQLVIQEINEVDSTNCQEEDFFVKAQKSAHKMYDELLELLDQLDDVYIKELLQNVLNDPEVMKKLMTWPAGKSIHHAYEAGLLEHILSCAKLSLILSPHYGANHNYVVAGAILHDLCKIYELSGGHDAEYTDEGKLVGHMAKSLELLDRFVYKMKHFPFNMKMHLKHILLAHHGEYAYGSPKLPQTSEAYLVHLIDYMDSKMNSLDTIKRNDHMNGNWSSYVRHLDRVVFKSSLPTYKEYLPERNEDHSMRSAYRNNTQSESKDSKGKKHPRKGHKDVQIKQNLGKLLEGFQVQNNDSEVGGSDGL